MNKPVGKHLLDIKSLEHQEIEMLLKRAEHWSEQKSPSGPLPLAGKFAVNLFFEPSTRTRFSFEVAQKKLGLNVLQFSAESSSVTKGETLYDTLKTLESMGVEAAVVRHRESRILEPLADRVNIRLINAGDGVNAHPTQFLLDVLTMKQHFGSLKGLQVAIIGDLRHSRVARSHLWGLPRLGADVMLSGPEQMIIDPQKEGVAYPERIRVLPVDEAIRRADVVMMLRIQLERHDGELFSSPEIYQRQYGLTLERAEQMKKEAVIMHPAPVNRGVEIADELVESEKSLILKQMENGVYTRMAVMERALGGMEIWQPYLQTVNM
ncbi:MAG: aspartate carbamoyltransferase catalytic subunit [Bacillaceae bacterium]|nr:aspartate carbamoyltransferase catalytic subunit [Bacillaceae bacterium]